jgi:hypothetical protein
MIAFPHPEQQHCSSESNKIKVITDFWRQVWVHEGLIEIFRHDSSCPVWTQRVWISSSSSRFARLYFPNCRSLMSVTFESNSKLQRIDESAFQGSGLKTIDVPASVEVVCKSCFSECKSLTLVTFESNSKLQRIDESAFRRSCTKP